MDVEKPDWSYIAGENITWHTHSGKRVGRFLTKINVLTIQPGNCPLGHLSQRNEIYVHMKTCTWMLTAALLVTAKNSKQPRRPSLGEWLNKAWYIHTMKYYWAKKKEQSTNTCNNLHGLFKIIVLSGKKVNPQRLHTIWFHLYNILEMTKLERWKTDLWLPEVGLEGREGRWLWLWKGSTKDPCDGTVLQLAVVTQIYT